MTGQRASAVARLTLAAIALSGAHAGSALAQSAWLTLDPATSAVGGRVAVRLSQGGDLGAAQIAAIEPKLVERFSLLQGSHVVDLAAPEAVQSVTSPEFVQAGPYLVVLTRGASFHELSPEAWAEFVARAAPGGLSASAAAAFRGPQRLRHWDFAKAIGQVGDDVEGSLHHRVVGQQLELVMLQNPAVLAAGEEQIVQVYFESQPLVGQRITAERRAADGSLMRLTRDTDARGTVRLQFPEPGLWLLRSAYLRRCQGCTDADWDSFAASFTVTVPAVQTQ